MSNRNRVEYTTISRRSFIKSTAGITGGLLMSPLISSVARAQQSHSPLGNWPAGVQGDSVFVGLGAPLTGPYSASGVDLKRGYELALEQINNGEGIGTRWESLAGKKGVLGKRIKWEIGDTETNANAAIQLMTYYIRDRKAMMISGGTSSSTAIALEKLAQREKIIDMVGVSGSNATTGVACQRYGFRSQNNAYMAGQALAPVVAKELGKNRKAAYLVPDYTYGHSVFRSTSAATEALGWETVAKVTAPVGTADYSSFLINLANSGADVFVNVAFGRDSVASTRQAKNFGILERMALVIPNISPFQAEALGPDIMAGVHGTMPFWWGMARDNEYARLFVTSFEEKYGTKPRWAANVAYLQMFLWADAIERAGTFYPPEVIKTFEEEKRLPTTVGEFYYRASDHQGVRPVPVVVGKKASEMEGPDDYFRVAGITPGEEVMPTWDQFSCTLGPYK